MGFVLIKNTLLNFAIDMFASKAANIINNIKWEIENSTYIAKYIL